MQNNVHFLQPKPVEDAEIARVMPKQGGAEMLRHRRTSFAVLVWVFLAVRNLPRAWTVPNYARQTTLPWSGCHYKPRERNPAGRQFNLLGYVDKADETKVITTEGGTARAALDLVASLFLSAVLKASFPSLQSPVPTTEHIKTGERADQRSSYTLAMVRTATFPC